VETNRVSYLSCNKKPAGWPILIEPFPAGNGVPGFHNLSSNGDLFQYLSKLYQTEAYLGVNRRGDW
jgi:hypothetical protein